VSIRGVLSSTVLTPTLSLPVSTLSTSHLIGTECHTLLPSMVMTFMSGQRLALRSKRRFPRCLMTSRARPEGPTLHFISPRPRSFHAPPSKWKRDPSDENTHFSSSSPVTCFCSSGNDTLLATPPADPKVDPTTQTTYVPPQSN
jgi:hypothetical protein